MSHFHTWKTTINHHITISQTKSQRQVVDAQIKNPARSKIVQHQSGSASHAPPPSKGLIAPTQILESAPELYHMDVGSDFLEPSHQSMEVESAWPNTVAGPSQITVLLPSKRPAQDVLAVSAPQLPPKRIRAEKRCWKCFMLECEGSRAKRYCKNPCDDCNRGDCNGRDSRRPTRPCQNKIDSPDAGGDGSMGQ